MNYSSLNLKDSAQAVLSKLRPYSSFIIIVVFLAVCIYQVSRISSLINNEPPSESNETTSQTTRSLKLDQKSIDQIMELESQNIEIKTIFENARDNPFND